MIDDNKSKLTTSEIVLRGTIIAVIITVPSIITFFISWIILENLISAVILGGVVHFIAMGFSLKISKNVMVKK
ncbi:MAG: hypothetical protein OEW86_10360 [Nitrosopumilus sp.]|nr:hypothetical protein [Nitrosopumilus sp.]MDH3516868.1 hypothetical protein [Nitrosopumilus sp.]MDH3565180.1 hypothetical protein [Nitrosopumilus sp.]MDH5418368.1 hypothetical protein [Nitrosopumilus sp.]MDH5555308.1 hypothetical protein [Nitrosopumilus sp.]